MNSFETDMRRAFLSKGFLLSVTVNLAILFLAGEDSDLYRVSVPVLCAFPYASAWLWDYQSGFLKLYLSRTSLTGYILGKIIACGLSGGSVGVVGGLIYQIIKRENGMNLELIFAVGALWAIVAATLAALTNSQYMVFGGAFVICYLLVIIQERYFKELYCINPNEWIAPKHAWILENTGILLLITTLCIFWIIIYYDILRRRIIHG